ncbi:MAG: hypothetical protein ACRYGK_08525 [Janthinobacterium lividum]
MPNINHALPAFTASPGGEFIAGQVDGAFSSQSATGKTSSLPLPNQTRATAVPLSQPNFKKRPDWANGQAGHVSTSAVSLCPAGLPWTASSKALVTRSRFVDANGQPFVTLDSPDVVRSRCANELLLEASKKNLLPSSELFFLS